MCRQRVGRYVLSVVPQRSTTENGGAGQLLGGRRDTLLKGLILAQNERWRRGLGMQVEGIPARVEPA